jgi:CheY-like chemotaxis protein
MVDVLYVDDDPGAREAISALVQAVGCNVEVVSSGYEAVIFLAGRPGVKVLLTDLNMPGMDGRQLARRVCRQHPHLRIVAVTGDRPSAAELGDCFDEVLHKPVSVRSLRPLVELVAEAPTL